MCWFFCFCFFLSPGGHNFRCLSFPGIYVCSFTGHSFLPWGSKADPPMAGDALFKMLHVLLQSSFTVLWVSTPKRFRGTGASRGSDPTVEVRSPLYDPTCHYEGRTACIKPPWRSKFFLRFPQSSSKAGLPAQLPTCLQFCLPSQDPRLAERVQLSAAPDREVGSESAMAGCCLKVDVERQSWCLLASELGLGGKLLLGQGMPE